MSFPLSFLTDLTNNNSSISFNGVGSTVNAEANTRALMELLDTLSNGETILGKVVSSKDGLLQIITNDNVLISAEAGDNVTLKEGSVSLFEVNKGSSGKVSLRPLYHNLNTEETAGAAIRQAGLPKNDRTMEMVARNMEYGKPIDRQSLIEAYRDVALHPDVPVKYIVDLQYMGIPGNEANYEQYRAYLNMENSVSDAFSEIGEAIVEELSKELSETIATVNPESTEAAPAGTAGVILDSLIELAETFEATGAEDVSFSKGELNEIINIISGNESEEVAQSGSSPALFELVSSEKESIPAEEVFKAVLSDIKKQTEAPKTEVFKPLGNEMAAEEELQTESKSAEPNILKLFETDRFKEVLSRALSSQWSLNREQISDKKEVRDLYERLFSQSSKLLSNLTETLGKESPVTARVQTLNDNLNFMNSLNNYVPYVQIPFRSDAHNANSELYVYKNKHSLSDPAGEISAFIHLDMESLGPTDVLVKLRDQNVTTNFTLKDDAALTLVHDNIHFLNKRLNDKGYSLESEMHINDKEETPMAEMLNATRNRIMVAKTSFDARV